MFLVSMSILCSIVRHYIFFVTYTFSICFWGVFDYWIVIINIVDYWHILSNSQCVHLVDQYMTKVMQLNTQYIYVSITYIFLLTWWWSTRLHMFRQIVLLMMRRIVSYCSFISSWWHKYKYTTSTQTFDISLSYTC